MNSDAAAMSPAEPVLPELQLLPAFQDNYVWLVHGMADRRRVAVVDPGDAAVVEAALSRDGLTLDAILITHHHADHVGGVEALIANHAGVPVYGPASEVIPGRTVALTGGETVRLPALGLEFAVLNVPGHTAGHIAYYGHGTLFCGDTLFSGGCGRLFEGTPAQMLRSLDRLGSLPGDTRVCCTHEYTAANLRFASVVEPNNESLARRVAQVDALRRQGLPSLPVSLAAERSYNPFLRSREPCVRAAAVQHSGEATVDPVSVFAMLRRWKDGFRG